MVVGGGVFLVGGVSVCDDMGDEVMLTSPPELAHCAPPHIVPFGKFHRIGGAPPVTFYNVKYDAPEELGGNRKCFDSPIWK